MLPGYYPLSNAWTPRERLLGLAFTALAAFNVFFVLSPRPAQSTAVLDFWATAKYIDLTHSIEPSMPVWEAFAQPSIGAALAGKTAAPIINATDEFTYGMQGFIATQVTLTTDQLGTQLDPPAHWNEYGATISDVPPTVALRPLVVVDITTSVKADPAYAAQVSDVEAWEANYGRVPYGSVVLFRSDWSKGWGKPSDVTDYPGVSLDTLKFLHLKRGILVHGHEPLDTDMTDNLEGEAWLMHNNFMQIEGVTNTHLLPPSGCLLSIGYPKIQGGTGGYARLVAICPGDWKYGVTISEAPGAPLATQPYPLRRGEDGVLKPTKGAKPTKYCSGAGSLGCPFVWND